MSAWRFSDRCPQCLPNRQRGNVRPTRRDEHLEIFSLDFLFCTCHSRSRPHRSVGETLRKENDEMNINRWHVFVPLVLRVAVGHVTVVSRHSFTAPLLEAKHQVNPLMKVFGHILTLQGGFVLLKKITGIWRKKQQPLLPHVTPNITETHRQPVDRKFTCGPRRKNDITN